MAVAAQFRNAWSLWFGAMDGLRAHAGVTQTNLHQASISPLSLLVDPSKFNRVNSREPGTAGPLLNEIVDDCNRCQSKKAGENEGDTIAASCTENGASDGQTQGPPKHLNG